MATSVDSTPPTQDKDPRPQSGPSESSLTESLIRRGLATVQEIEACKAHRAKLAAQSATGKDEASKSLLDIMVEAKVLTKNQSIRLLREASPEASKLRQIPGYQILSKLGKGSMGIVYKARQASVDRVVAVKVLLETLAQNKEFIKRFKREAEIAARLSHNNIVNVFDAGEVDGHHYFVMEYVEGATVKDELDKGKMFDEKVAVKVVLAVAEALEHAHKRGLIHRDIKPENIILTKEGGVKLADLGLARLTTDEQWALAESGMAIGTPYYISPEQVRGQTDVDIRADIYGLGATLYHMVTGKVPFGGSTPNEVMKKHLDKNIQLVPPDHLNTKLSSGLGQVVETMMARNRENRYATPDDLILDLKCLIQGESPMIAGQKLDSLATLAEGEADGDRFESAVAEEERLEMARVVNSRNTIIAALGVLLGLSILTNLLMLFLKR
ncbi:MAG: serine/threonine-protein kinase [Isosphaeraceae bacterium]|nr:serine/threonine-protein kinase [Isosphaeraceae bacterium]